MMFDRRSSEEEPPTMGEPDALVSWPLGVYLACVAAVAFVMVGAPYLLGQRHADRATGQPYESGIVSEGSARFRMTSQFYLVAMLFVIFDLEAVFIFSWAVAARDLGWAGYGVILIFVALLLVALLYLVRVGALSWGPTASGSASHQRAPGSRDR
jgi:NADH-quinone oxidoreductase subunit A